MSHPLKMFLSLHETCMEPNYSPGFRIANIYVTWVFTESTAALKHGVTSELTAWSPRLVFTPNFWGWVKRKTLAWQSQVIQESDRISKQSEKWIYLTGNS